MKIPCSYSTRFSHSFVLAMAAALVAAPLSSAELKSRSDTGTAQDVLLLSPFEVSSGGLSRYEVADATSGGRVRVAIFDSPQSISVIPQQLMADLGAASMIASTKYLAGISASSVAGSDRISIRGFEVNGRTVDGFTSDSKGKLDIGIIERIEFVKGPNAVISPSGVPGGTINLVTKKPELRDFGSVTIESGRYEADRAVLDVNRRAGGNLAWRFVTSWKDTEGYMQDSRYAVTVMPALTWRFGQNSQLMLQATFIKNQDLNFTGLPVATSAGTNRKARVLAGLPRNHNPNDEEPSNWRGERRQDFLAIYTGKMLDVVSVRFAAHYLVNHLYNSQWNNSAPTGGGVDPASGNFVPGFTFGPAPTFTPRPAPQPTNLFTRGVLNNYQFLHTWNLQNDYFYDYKSDRLESTTLGGVAGNVFDNNTDSRAATKPSPFDLFEPVASVPTYGALTAWTFMNGNSQQLYANETLKFWQRRVALSAGLSQNWFDQKIDDYVRKSVYGTKPSTLLKNFGVVLQPVPEASLYFGHSESATQLNQPPTGSPLPALQSAEQHEIGLRLKFLGGRGVASVACYEITQDNLAIFNVGNLAVPPPNPPLAALLSDRKAKGWEYEISLALSTQWSVLASYTQFTNRNKLGIPFRGTAERSGGLTARYDAGAGPLKGFGFSLGVNHVGKRPGDQASGVTAASTLTNIITVKPTFYLAAYTQVDLAASYRINSRWLARVFVDNLMNEDYLAAALSRFSVTPSTPINPRISLMYTF